MHSEKSPQNSEESAQCDRSITITLREFLNILITYDAKISSVNSRSIENLSDYVRRVRQEKGLSTLVVERNSGNQITDGYVSQIENGYVKNVSPKKLQALAKGLSVPEEEIFAVARGRAPTDDPSAISGFFRMLYEKLLKVPEDKLPHIVSLFKMVDREMDTLIALELHKQKLRDPARRKRLLESIDVSLGDPLGTAERLAEEENDERSLKKAGKSPKQSAKARDKYKSSKSPKTRAGLKRGSNNSG